MALVRSLDDAAAIPLANRAAQLQDEGVASQLALDDLKELCQVVTAEMGLSVEGVQRYGRYLDLALGSTVLLRPRRVLLRLTTEPPDRRQMAELAREAADRGCADYLLVTTRPPVDRSLERSEHLLGPAQFMELCRRSYAVGWRDAQPVPKPEIYRQIRFRSGELDEIDRFGLAWLPALSRNRLPWQLRNTSTPADERFEQSVFRIATSLFRLDGVRLGAASRGKRVGDALLWRRGLVVLVDCKAAQNGYRLEVDDERRLLEYVRTGSPSRGPSGRIACVVLVSSGFPVFETDARRFAARRRRFIAEGSDLACVRADDLVDAALIALGAADDTRRLDAIAWDRVLAQGLVTRTRLLAHCVRAIRNS